MNLDPFDRERVIGNALNQLGVTREEAERSLELLADPYHDAMTVALAAIVQHIIAERPTMLELSYMGTAMSLTAAIFLAYPELAHQVWSTAEAKGKLLGSDEELDYMCAAYEEVARLVPPLRARAPAPSAQPHTRAREEER